jgi:glycosyltransferase involved in cell wall biosynthesis
MNARRPRLLAIFPQAPWPARQDGISVRFYPLLQELATAADIDLLVLGDFREEVPDDPLLRQMRNVSIRRFARSARPPGVRGLLRAARLSMPWAPPFKYSRYNVADVIAEIRRTLARGNYDVVWWIGIEYAEALVAVRDDLRASKLVLDLVDSPYLNYSRLPPPAGVSGWHHRYDVWKTRRFERRLRACADTSVYISPPDAAAVLAPDEPPRAEIIPNGVYTRDFAEPDVTADARDRRGPRIGFLGHMAYAPNVAAVLTLHEKIFLPLREQFPDLELVIIGRDPDARVRALAGPQVTVTGAVASIWPFVMQVDVFVFPLFTGSGLHNKILEAMFAVTPVVTSDICRAAIGPRGTVPVRCGSSVEEIRECLRQLLADPAEARHLAWAAREFVLRTFDWTALAERYRALLLADRRSPSA